jgi:F-type H+-transporting ATPase subunit delta
MEKDNLHSPLAQTYAQALLELAATEPDTPGGAEMIGQQLIDVRKALLDEPFGMALLVDPAIGDDERHKLLDRVFAGRISPLLLKFFHILGEKGRLGILAGIAMEFKELLDKQQGKVEADLTVAQRLDGDALESVRQRISAALKREVILHQYVDPAILGGLVLRIQDKLIDGSVRAQLAAMREKIVAARPA